MRLFPTSGDTGSWKLENQSGEFFRLPASSFQYGYPTWLLPTGKTRNPEKLSPSVSNASGIIAIEDFNFQQH